MTASKLPTFLIWKSPKPVFALFGFALSLPLIFSVSIAPIQASP
ncbi:hypothetical protein V1291_003780 [Nitrobacteraceae bacterium AZCC 1564]